MVPPNVILITTDQWPGSLLGCAGHPVIQTPTLDLLAREGIRFDQALSECPACIPARRSLMTGLSPRSHGTRSYQTRMPLPPMRPTLPDCFRAGGYQTGAVGKLHLFPIRQRYGFDEVVLSEEGRMEDGTFDDYDIYLADRGYPGQHFAHGLGSNSYETRSWHLPEDVHVTNWATKNMVRMIQRRDPTKPAFWYLSYIHPHPPLAALSTYLDLYRDADIDLPFLGEWINEAQALNPLATREARRAYYALCTHIDHQIRLVIAALRQEGILDHTIIVFSSDHGEMLGNHGRWGKRSMLAPSVSVPLIFAGASERIRRARDRIDHRLVLWQDLMPSLLDLAALPIPPDLDGQSVFSATPRPHAYCEYGEEDSATRMILCDHLKLIYEPARNQFLLFDVVSDPQEMTNLATKPAHAHDLHRLQNLLRSELYGPDLHWLDGEEWKGAPAPTSPRPAENALHLGNQRSYLFPPPEATRQGR